MVSGSFTADERERALQVIARALAEVRHPVEDPRVRITRHRGPAPFVVVQANVTVAERLVRAQASAPTVAEAAGRAAARLSHRLSLLGRYLNATGTGHPVFAGTRRAHLPANPRPWLPMTGRGLLRSKLVPLAVQPPDAAALSMTLRDYDFHIFVDDTGGECVVHRDRSGGYGLLRLPGNVRQAIPLAEAVERLNTSLRLRYLFFADPGSGRGRVLYRRYDGHLGLITPAW